MLLQATAAIDAVVGELKNTTLAGEIEGVIFFEKNNMNGMTFICLYSQYYHPGCYSGR